MSDQPSAAQVLKAVTDLSSQVQALQDATHTVMTQQSDLIRVSKAERATINDGLAGVRADLESLRPASAPVLNHSSASSTPVLTPIATPVSAPSSVPSVPGSSSSDKTVKIMDPAVFSGDRDDFPRWMAQVKFKLSENAFLFPNDEARINYLLSRLSGDAAQQLLPFLASGSGASSFSSVSEFYQVLEYAFGDPDRKTTAQNKLETLFQGNKEFAVYYAEFERTAAYCGYCDEALKSRLRRSLAPELQYALVMVPDSEVSTYKSLACRCQQLDNNLRAVAKNSRFRGLYPPVPSLSSFRSR